MTPSPDHPTQSPPRRLLVRDATLADAQAIVAFNLALARETENKSLHLDLLRAGVEKALLEPDRLRYWVALLDDSLVGMAGITREWSDWRNGWIWWYQSVYVQPDARGQGVMAAIFAAIRNEAKAEKAVGMRLYVERQNVRAQAFYRRQGLDPGGYEVYEQIW